MALSRQMTGRSVATRRAAPKGKAEPGGDTHGKMRAKPVNLRAESQPVGSVVLDVLIIAIAGPSGSGKSLFARTVVEEVAALRPGLSPVLLKEDSYYRDQSALTPAQRARVNYDHPGAIEQTLLLQHLITLRRGEAVKVPRYDYSFHSRSSEVDTVHPASVIIVEGILLLANQSLRETFDMRFFMDTPLDICLLRRMQRDQVERGRSIESISRQYLDSVRPMYQEFIAPSARHADLLITGGGRNRVALDMVRDRVLQRLDGAR
jgi:uridine kinase